MTEKKTMMEIRADLRWSASLARNRADGLRRAQRLDDFLDQMIPSYAGMLGVSTEDLFFALEANRQCSALNYYCEDSFPPLDRVQVFDTLEAFKKRYPSGKYRCPSCNGISTNPYECNSGATSGDKVCSWKSYGLFGTLGKGIYVVVRGDFMLRPRVDEIFRPLDGGEVVK